MPSWQHRSLVLFHEVSLVFVSLVSETFPPDINGVATTLARLHGGLREHGHRCQVVCPRGAMPRSLADGFEVPGISLPFYREVRLGWPASKRLERAWTDDPPDLVHIVTEGPLGRAALSVASRLSLPVTSSLHTNFHAYARHYGVAWATAPVAGYLRRFHNRTRLTFIPTRQQAEQLASSGFERLSVLGRGVDGECFSPDRRDEALRQSWGASVDTPVVLHVGRLASEKDPALLRASVEAVREACPDAVCVIVGDGPRRAWLEKRLPGVVFAGMRQGEDLARHYASADWFLFPSRTETFGNVVLEAMASGLPVLSFDCAAGSELIDDGENGYLVPVDAPQQFVDQAARLVRARRFPSEGMRVQARQAALARGWGQVCAEFEQRLMEVVEGQPMPGRAELLS